MVSTESRGSRRKPPEERRSEIVAAAADIALEEGLEKVVLRTVASRLGVRPGLISHYFPSVDELVATAFRRAVSDERRRILVDDGSPLRRIRHLVEQVQSPRGVRVARLWLNARHLARFRPLLVEPIEMQEEKDQAALVALIEAGAAEGVFRVSEPRKAAVRILMAVDGFGAYVNMGDQSDPPGYAGFVADVTEWALGMKPGTISTP